MRGTLLVESGVSLTITMITNFNFNYVIVNYNYIDFGITIDRNDNLLMTDDINNETSCAP